MLYKVLFNKNKGVEVNIVTQYASINNKFKTFIKSEIILYVIYYYNQYYLYSKYYNVF